MRQRLRQISSNAQTSAAPPRRAVTSGAAWRRANGWRVAERLSRWAAVAVTALAVVSSLWAVRFDEPIARVEAHYGLPLPASARALVRSGDPVGENVYTVVRISASDAPAFVAGVKRKLRSARDVKYFGFPHEAWRDEPNGSRVYLCEWGVGADTLIVTVEPERAGAVIVHLTTVTAE